MRARKRKQGKKHQINQVKYNLIWEQLYYARKRKDLLSQSTGAKNATSARKAAYAAANAAESKKANGTVVLDVKQVTTMAEFFVITGGDSPAQIRAIVDAIDDALSELGYKHGKVEGRQDGRWVLIDFGDVIIHVLHEKERSFYKLEQFWNHALIVQKDEWDADKNG
jgi:ribosome-associated protein